MKMILAGVLLMLPLLCQAQKNLFNKYGDMKGVVVRLHIQGNDRNESQLVY